MWRWSLPSQAPTCSQIREQALSVGNSEDVRPVPRSRVSSLGVSLSSSPALGNKSKLLEAAALPLRGPARWAARWLEPGAASCPSPPATDPGPPKPSCPLCLQTPLLRGEWVVLGSVSFYSTPSKQGAPPASGQEVLRSVWRLLLLPRCPLSLLFRPARERQQSPPSAQYPLRCKGTGSL